MNNKWIYIILLCSLMFNAILAGFIIYHLMTRPLPGPTPPRFDFNRERMLERHREIGVRRTEFQEHKLHFINSLASPHFNELASKEELEILLQKQIEMERVIGMNLIDMRKNMNDEQAERFFKEFPLMMGHDRNMLHRRR